MLIAIITFVVIYFLVGYFYIVKSKEWAYIEAQLLITNKMNDVAKWRKAIARPVIYFFAILLWPLVFISTKS